MKEYQEKYAVGSLIKPGMVKFGCSEDLNVMGYFVSKVYVVEELKIENVKDVLYKIVFPYPDLRSGVEVKPELNDKGEVINSVLSFDVYDDKDKAVMSRDMLNRSLFDRKLINVYEKNYSNRNCRKIFEQEREKAQNDLDECFEYERNLEAIEFNHKPLQLRK